MPLIPTAEELEHLKQRRLNQKADLLDAITFQRSQALEARRALDLAERAIREKEIALVALDQLIDESESAPSTE